MTPNKLVEGLSHQDVAAIAAEALAWRKNGILEGTLLRDLATRMIIEARVPEDDSLLVAASLIVHEAAVRYADGV